MDVARRHNANVKIIECICSNQDLHRERTICRKRNIEGLPEIEWEYVKKVEKIFSKWEDEHLTLDSLHPFDENCLLAKQFIAS